MARLTGLTIGDEPEALTALGLVVVEGDRACVGGVTIHATGAGARRGIHGLALDGVAEGLPTTTVVPVPEGDHPLGAVAVDHVVVLADDVAGAIRGAGLEARRTEVRDGRRYAYVVVGTALLEFVGPAEPVAEPRAARPWGLALSVTDLDAAVALLGSAVSEPRDAFQPGRRIATVRHEQIGLTVPTVLLTPR